MKQYWIIKLDTTYVAPDVVCYITDIKNITHFSTELPEELTLSTTKNSKTKVNSVRVIHKFDIGFMFMSPSVTLTL